MAVLSAKSICFLIVETAVLNLFSAALRELPIAMILRLTRKTAKSASSTTAARLAAIGNLLKRSMSGSFGKLLLTAAGAALAGTGRFGSLTAAGPALGLKRSN